MILFLISFSVESFSSAYCFSHLGRSGLAILLSTSTFLNKWRFGRRQRSFLKKMFTVLHGFFSKLLQAAWTFFKAQGNAARIFQAAGTFYKIFHEVSMFLKISLRALMLHVKSSCSFDQGC